jgi:hypothetical protein
MKTTTLGRSGLEVGEDSHAAADLTLTEADLVEIEKIMAAAAPVDGPSPERV